VFAFLSALAYSMPTQWLPMNWLLLSTPWFLVIAVILLMVSGFCDTLDGILARNYQQATAFGGFLDSLLDRYADAAVFAGIIIGGLCNPIVGLVVLLVPCW